MERVMPDSLQQLTAINTRFAELIPLISAASGEECAAVAPMFEEIRSLLESARKLTSSAHLDPTKAREVLANYRHHLIAVRHAMGRLEPLLTERRAQLRQELEHIRNTSAWASSVREQAEAKVSTR
jgi:septation ring formation regulator EzrA